MIGICFATSFSWFSFVNLIVSTYGGMIKQILFEATIVHWAVFFLLLIKFDIPWWCLLYDFTIQGVSLEVTEAATRGVL